MRQPATAPDPLAYTRGGAALASGVPTVTIDQAIKAGELGAIRSGRRLIILRDDLLAWLRSCKERGAIPVRVSQDDRERLAELNRARKRDAEIETQRAA